MRKIMTKAEIQKKKKRNLVIIGLIMIFLMVFATAAYSFMESSRNKEEAERNIVVENDITFYRFGEFWRAQIADQVFEFSYLPSEVSDVVVEGNFALAEYTGQTIYFNDLQEGSYEIIKNLHAFIQRAQEACVYDETCDKDLPVKDCFDNLFIFQESENDKVYKSEKCVYISGDGKKGADAFLYKLLWIN
jgi:hypothetical protein